MHWRNMVCMGRIFCKLMMAPLCCADLHRLTSDIMCEWICGDMIALNVGSI